MRIINNASNVSAKFQGLPSNFVSNNVQTIVNDPVIPECKCDVCIFFDFCSGCYFNPCDFKREENCNSFPEPIEDCFDRFKDNRNCNCRCCKCNFRRNRNNFCKRRYNCKQRHFDFY